MNSTQIELLAVNAISESMLNTELLSPLTTANDKGPSWDGEILVYKDKEQKKEDLLARVPIQIKGKICNKWSEMSKNEIKYPVSRIDMQNYFNDGGLIYFVVYIYEDKKTNEIKKNIYYNSLLPVDLKKHLDESKTQKQKSLRFKVFPEKNKTDIFINFINNKKRQAGFSEDQFLSLEDFKKIKGNKKITICCSGYGMKTRIDFEKAIIDGDVYLYLEKDELGIPIPIDKNFLIKEIKRPGKTPIKVNGVIYNLSNSLIEKKGEIILEIGESLKLSKKNGERKLKFTYESSKKLSDRIKNDDFLIEAIKNKGFKFGEVYLDMGKLVPEMQTHMEKIINELEYLKKIKELFNLLNVNKDLNLVEITDKDRFFIDVLLKTFFEKKDIVMDTIFEKEKIATFAKNGVILVKFVIQDITLSLIVKPNEDGIKCKIYDFFNYETTVFRKINIGSENKTQIVSKYFILGLEDYLEIDNFNYDSVFQEYKELTAENPSMFEDTNNNLIRLLLAYDKVEDEYKKDKLLILAEKVARLIFDEDKNNIVPYEVKKINFLQIIKRKRSLNEEEIEYLHEITENNKNREDILTAAYILMDDGIGAKRHFKQLSIEEQNRFKEFPINIFWNVKKCVLVK